MADDIVARIDTLLEGATEGSWGTYGDGTHEVYQEPTGDDEGQYICYQVVRAADARFIAAARTLVPELRDEIVRLREAGPWTQHVERQRAMKRERDGDCICNTGPETDGPEEECPWHGREYQHWIRALAVQEAEVERLRGALNGLVSQWKAIAAVEVGGGYGAALEDNIAAIEDVLRGDQ
ncbi:hypothetical protein [Mycolicibacter heraklionensis]|uniref:hypothetical protein n=1 Tax=Mycolicibacter heraklionensis TaxID=512402 RepID=UPI0007E983B0|nr:hypothetical protein [Mycolicibacter heraklionensis]OBG32395.1 hypothetical protein A5671_07635 [Mycolicibacter heraklionensis]